MKPKFCQYLHDLKILLTEADTRDLKKWLYEQKHPAIKQTIIRELLHRRAIRSEVAVPELSALNS